MGRFVPKVGQFHPPLPATALFPQVVDHLYFRGHAVLDELLDGLRCFHHAGPNGTDRSGVLFRMLTRRLESLADPNDLGNALSVIVAELISIEGRGPDGRLVPEKLADTWGDSVASVLERLLTTACPEGCRHRPDNPVTRNELFRFVSAFAPLRMHEVLACHELPQRLPLVDYLVNELGGLDESIGALVCVQHLFGSTVPLVLALAGDRIPAGGVFILGKPYSTNQAALWKLRSLGYHVHSGSSSYGGATEYHADADRYIESFLTRAVRWLDHARHATGRRILLIDDGGRAIRRLHAAPFRDVLPRFACVEQTRCGIRALDGIDLETPVVNVAESRVKLNHESELIAESVKTELLKQLHELRAAGVALGSRVLVIGYGAIGRAVAQAMAADSFKVGVYDTHRQQRTAALADGFAVEDDLHPALGEYNVLIGCTGRAVLDFDDYRRLRDGAVLASASSSDVEFRAWQLRTFAGVSSARHRFVDEFNLVYERYQGRPLYLGDLDDPCHFLYVIRFEGKTFFLLNGGFPVNMDGGVDPIAASRIQLTRGLLYAGAVQASRTRAAGLHELSPAAQDKLLARYLALSGGAAREEGRCEAA